MGKLKVIMVAFSHESRSVGQVRTSELAWKLYEKVMMTAMAALFIKYDTK